MKTANPKGVGVTEGVFVEVMSDGSSGLAFDTPFHSLAMSELLYQSSRENLLLREVLVSDKDHPMHGRTGYISSVERDTQSIAMLVVFAPEDETTVLNASQLQLMGNA